LRAANPRLITASISPFGDDGPRADWPASDLTVWAAAGPLLLAGDADRAPVRTTTPQSWQHAAGEAADAALVALWERQTSGRGQHVSVSAQLAGMQATQCAILADAIGGTSSQRVAGGGNFGGLEFRIVWPAADGHVTIAFLFGASLGPFTARLMEWICEEGGCDEAIRDKDWVDYGMALHNGTETAEDYANVRSLVEAFTSKKTKAELLEGAVARKLLIAPIYTIDDVASSEQMRARGFWEDVEVPQAETGETIRFPGRFARADRAELPFLGPPPRLGEHQSLLDGLDVERPEDPGEVAPTTSGSAISAAPLDGLKVLDFCWAVAGPLMTRFLADFGATVVRVESSANIDVGRTVGPFIDDEPGPDNSAIYNNLNAGKHSIALDLAKPEAIDVVEDLVRWADVLTESFAPGVLGRIGLDDETLRQLNPELVVIHSSIMGQTGPLAAFAGIGTMGAAITGFYNLTGWPDRLPAGPFSAYSDYVAPRFAIAAILAALDRRRRDGDGLILDFSQAEAATHFLSPTLLDHFVNGTSPIRAGNDDRNLAPHGVFPTAGDDQWVAVACPDRAWERLAGWLERPELADLDLGARQARGDELHGLITARTSARSGDEVAEELAALGVAAYPVLGSAAALADPQLRHVGHFIEVDHPGHDTTTVEGPRARLSRTPGSVTWAGPPISHHAYDVLEGLLGYDADRIAEIAIAEALE
ncbi:MAG: CoA transferase, partial [Acidimicrobiia bacterium]|nr:CoA transferase [Acidimicrobiia bacterium]